MTKQQNIPIGTPEKNADIECLRAVAIIFTLILHTSTLLPTPSNIYNIIVKYLELSVGVDLFFVVSGFVITNSLFAAGARYNTSPLRAMASFWIKRVFRLLPTSFLWLALLMVYYSITGELFPLMKPILAAMFNVMNLYNAYCVANPGDPLLCGVVFFHGHYWSLSLEEQFYLIYPLLFFFLNRRLLVISIVFWIVIQLFWHRPIWTYGWFFRTDALCWGILLAFMVQRDFYSKLRPTLLNNKVVSFVVFILLSLLLAYAGRQCIGFGAAAKTYGVGLIAFIGAIMVWIASYDADYFCGYQPIKKIMLYLGARSYALYVSHLIIFTIVVQKHSQLLFNFDISNPRLVKLYVCTIGYALTIICTELTYRMVEVPIREKGRQLSKKLTRKALPKSIPHSLDFEKA